MIIIAILVILVIIIFGILLSGIGITKNNDKKEREPKVPPLTKGRSYPWFYLDECLYYFPASKRDEYENDTEESLLEKLSEAQKRGNFEEVIEICDQIIAIDYKLGRVWLDKINAIFNNVLNGENWTVNTSKSIVNCCYNYVKTFSNSYDKSINTKHLLVTTITKRVKDVIDYNLDNMSETYNFELYNLLINLYYLMPFYEFLEVASSSLDEAKLLKEVQTNPYANSSIKSLTRHILMLKDKHKVDYENKNVDSLKITRKAIINDEKFLTTWVGFNIHFPNNITRAELIFKFYDYRRQEIDLSHGNSKRYIELFDKKNEGFYNVVILGEDKIKYVTVEVFDENKKHQLMDSFYLEDEEENEEEIESEEIEDPVIETQKSLEQVEENKEIEVKNLEIEDKSEDIPNVETEKEGRTAKTNDDIFEGEFEENTDEYIYKSYPNYSNVKQISLCENYGLLLRENGYVEVIGFPEKNIDVSLWENIDTIYTTNFAAYAIRKDGTITVTGNSEYDNWEYQYVWKDIQKLEIAYKHLVGLKNDGSVVAVGDNTVGQCEVKDWVNIVDISASFHTVALDKDGKVYALGENTFGECDIENWDNIDKIATGPFFTVGLRNNGTVVAAGLNSCGQCNTSNWTDVKEIYVKGNVTVGLRNDGKVYVAGRNSYRFEDAKKWHNIENIKISNERIIGISTDGRINYIGKPYWGRVKEEWKNVVSIEANSNYLVGKKVDNRLICNKTLFGMYLPNSYNNFADIKQNNKADKVVVLGKDGKIDIYAINNVDLYKWETNKFNNVKQISMSNTHLVGVRRNGTVAITGNDTSLNFVAESWKKIIKAEVGENYVVGLNSDGRVVATGNNFYGQCDVNDWVDIVDIVVYGNKTLGLKSDGTVLIKGLIEYDEESFIKEAQDIKSIAINSKQIMLLNATGRVSLSYNPYGSDKQQILEWRNIEKIIPTENGFIALKNDKTLLTTGDEEIGHWRNICDVKAAGKTIIGMIKKV